MSDRERRRQASADSIARLRAGLTAGQLRTLETMEQFGWRLAFVRRPLFQEPLPVVIDRDGKRHALLEADGSINEAPGFALRG